MAKADRKSKPVKRNPETAGVKKPRRYKSGTVALREIRYQQKNSTVTACAAAPFDRVIREVASGYLDKVRFTREAIRDLQAIAEDYVIKTLERTNLMAIHASRVTIMPRDIRLAVLAAGGELPRAE